MKGLKKIYFASDQHFGAPNEKESRIREKKFVKWLSKIEKDADIIFLLGDLFDFWFEYKKAVPKGFVRVLGKLAQLRDKGIEIHFFVGNHDLWMENYFQTELQIPVYHQPKEFTFSGKTFFIGHGDGLGPNDKGYKHLKKVFTNTFSQWLFRWLHPDVGIRLGQYFSLKNKMISGKEHFEFSGNENEWLVQYCYRKLKEKHRDFFVFGHRHLPLNVKLNNSSTYINTGDWIDYFTYAIFDGEKITLQKFE